MRCKAAIEAGVTRFRPVLMTALAMIIGMAPMALGLGEGGEQNAPLGRAVIGGLMFATFATLFFVPALFALVRGRRRRLASNWRRSSMSPENDPDRNAAQSEARRHRGGCLLGRDHPAVGAYIRFVEASDLQELDREAEIPDRGADRAQRRRQGPGAGAARHAAGLL